MEKRILLTAIFYSLLLTSVVAQSNERINSLSTQKNVEFSPSISADGKTLIFQSDRGTAWELYKSELIENNWGEASPLTTINEKCDFIAGPSLSYDGNMLYYTAFIEDITTSEDIYFSKRLEGGEWSTPKSIGAPINTDEYEGFPSISSDGQSLYFIRVNNDNPYNKKQKEYCFSIYLSRKDPSGKWGEPERLPETINSGCERDPKIMADNKTLIFSSIKADGMGKYDMYQSELQDDGTWSPPVALSYINSKANDQSPTISASGDRMFYFSDNDIYVVNIPEEYHQNTNVTVQGYVVGANGPEEATIEVTEAASSEVIARLTSNPADGHYSLVLPAGGMYTVSFKSGDYINTKLSLDYTSTERYQEEQHNINLKNDYELQLRVKDVDLKKEIPSFITIYNESKNETVYDDSTKISALPLAFRLNSTDHYLIKAQSKGYQDLEKKWVFNPDITTDPYVYDLEMEYEKVRTSIEVTDVSSNRHRMKVYFNNQDEDEVIIADSGEDVFLRRGDRYEVVTSSDKGYAFSSTYITAGEGEQNADSNYQLHLNVYKIEAGAQLTLNNINFPVNSADLDSTSYFTLDRVIDLLRTNAQITIEIAAHSDDVGNDTFNLNLSEKRAQSVVNYLTSHDIPKERLVARGYGESRPLVPNTSKENRARNRRVEVMVLTVE